MLAADILPDLRSAASHELAFLARVPPLGYATYTIAAEDDSTRLEQSRAAQSTTRSGPRISSRRALDLPIPV